jgi:hypothetical protein
MKSHRAKQTSYRTQEEHQNCTLILPREIGNVDLIFEQLSYVISKAINTRGQHSEKEKSN